jgi:hypothetical protein
MDPRQALLSCRIIRGNRGTHATLLTIQRHRAEGQADQRLVMVQATGVEESKHDVFLRRKQI